MLKHDKEVPSARHRPHAGWRPGARPLAVASLVLVAGLSFTAFIALYRAPLPTDAFTALAVQLVDRADMARNA